MALLDPDEIDERMRSLDGWSREGETIVKSFTHGDFLGSIDFVNRVAPLAEEMGHHPDLAISWATVEVTITTHSQGGLTASDFALAGRIDGLS